MRLDKIAIVAAVATGSAVFLGSSSDNEFKVKTENSKNNDTGAGENSGTKDFTLPGRAPASIATRKNVASNPTVFSGENPLQKMARRIQTLIATP